MNNKEQILELLQKTKELIEVTINERKTAMMLNNLLNNIGIMIDNYEDKQEVA